MDIPGPDIIDQRKAVPTIQGIFLYLGIIIALWVNYPEILTNHYGKVFAWASAWLLLLACVDEYASLLMTKKRKLTHLVDVIPSRVKLLIQSIIVGVAIGATWMYQMELLWADVLWQVPHRLWWAVAFVWFIVFINAINRFDGIPGQASWLSSIAFLTIILLLQYIVLPYYDAISPENAKLLSLVTVLASLLCIWSLLYTVIEFKPRWLVRDAGTLLYGFSLAYISLLWWTKIGILLVVLSLPLFDAVWVFLHRLFVMKKNPMKGDYTHLHHRLLALNWQKSEARFFVRCRSIIMMILMLLQWVNRFNKIVIFIMMALLFFGINAYLFRYKKIPVTKIMGNKGSE